MPSDNVKNILLQTALRYLGHRDRFKKEIELRLKKQILSKKLPQESLDLVPDILAKLEKSGLINDQELVKRYVKHQQEDKLRGPHAIKQRLMAMGAPRDLIESSIREQVTRKSQNTAIDNLIKKAKPDIKDFKKLAKLQRLLVYRGFDTSQIREKIALIGNKE
jgi:SOS response regulatory protein OraA/RecX